MFRSSKKLIEINSKYLQWGNITKYNCISTCYVKDDVGSYHTRKVQKYAYFISKNDVMDFKAKVLFHT